LKCPHCLVEFHATTECMRIGADKEGNWGVEMYLCPNPDCGKRTVYLVQGDPHPASGQVLRFDSVQKRIMVRPKGLNRPPVPSEVPTVFAEDYVEACLVLPDSPKASAALSRRCLQNLLREKAKVKHGKLADEIDQVINDGTLPSYLVEVIDAVRNVGNLAAHPLTSQTTGEILPVEPWEAEWNLEVLESLFDFYFVQPTLVAKKKAALDKKLEEGGQKPMKG